MNRQYLEDDIKKLKRQKSSHSQKEFLTATAMRGYVVPGRKERVKEMIQDKAQKGDKKGNKLKPFTPPAPETKLPPAPPAEIYAKALEYAKLLYGRGNDARDTPGKVRRMDTLIARVSQPEDVFVRLCKLFPKAKDPTQKAFMKMSPLLETWDVQSFQKMFRTMRIYYEALNFGHTPEEE